MCRFRPGMVAWSAIKVRRLHPWHSNVGSKLPLVYRTALGPVFPVISLPLRKTIGTVMGRVFPITETHFSQLNSTRVENYFHSRTSKDSPAFSCSGEIEWFVPVPLRPQDC